jgi:hypothetical protein
MVAGRQCRLERAHRGQHFSLLRTSFGAEFQDTSVAGLCFFLGDRTVSPNPSDRRRIQHRDRLAAWRNSLAGRNYVLPWSSLTYEAGWRNRQLRSPRWTRRSTNPTRAIDTTGNLLCRLMWQTLDRYGHPLEASFKAGSGRVAYTAHLTMACHRAPDGGPTGKAIARPSEREARSRKAAGGGAGGAQEAVVLCL